MADRSGDSGGGWLLTGLGILFIVLAVILFVDWLEKPSSRLVINPPATSGPATVTTTPSGGITVVYPPAQQQTVVPRAQASTVSRSPSSPAQGSARLPSAGEMFRRAEHKKTYVCVPCVDGYVQNEETCDCTRTVWRPGPPPR